jgi:hypothetical protein
MVGIKLVFVAWMLTGKAAAVDDTPRPGAEPEAGLEVYELYRHLYRYIHQDYVGGVDATDQLVAMSMMAGRVAREDLQHWWDNRRLPPGDLARARLVPELAELPWDLSARDPRYPMSGDWPSDDFPPDPSVPQEPRRWDGSEEFDVPNTPIDMEDFLDLDFEEYDPRDPRYEDPPPVPTVPATPYDEDWDREYPGQVFDWKNPEPALHSAYNHAAQVGTVSFEGLEMTCEVDSDCNVFDLPFDAHCLTGQGGAEYMPPELSPMWAGETALQYIDAEADSQGVCGWGPQWFEGDYVMLQGRNLWSTDLKVIVTSEFNEVQATAQGLMCVNPSTGESVPVATSQDCDVLDDAFVKGGQAVHYLKGIYASQRFHASADAAATWPDLVQFQLPEEMEGGTYKIVLAYDTADLIHGIAFLSDVVAQQAAFLGDEPLTDEEILDKLNIQLAWALGGSVLPVEVTNPVLLRVPSANAVEESVIVDLVGGVALDAQEGEDELVVNTMAFTLDFGEMGVLPGSATSLDDAADAVVDALLAGALPPGWTNPAIFSPVTANGLDDNDGFAVGQTYHTDLAANRAVLVVTDLWEDDGSSVVDKPLLGLNQSMPALATAMILAAYPEGCSDDCPTGLDLNLMAGSLAAEISSIADNSDDPEFLGQSVFVAPYETIVLLSKAAAVGEVNLSFGTSGSPLVMPNQGQFMDPDGVLVIYSSNGAISESFSSASSLMLQRLIHADTPFDDSLFGENAHEALYQLNYRIERPDL